MRKKSTRPAGALLSFKEPAPLMTVKEIAQLLQVSKQAVYCYCREGILPGVVRIGPRRILVERAQLMEWIEQGGTSPRKKREK